MVELPRVSADFIKKINRNKNTRKLKKFLIITLVVFIGVLFARGECGLLKIYRLLTKVEKTQKEIDRLKVQAVDLNWEINRLKSDSQYIKLYAAEKYGYAKSDETIIQFLPLPEDSLR